MTSQPSRHHSGFAQQLPANVALLILSSLVSFILIDITCGIWIERFADNRSFLIYASFDQLTRRRGYEEPLYTPHRYIGYYPTPGYERGKNRHNSLGYRGAEFAVSKPAGEYRIACLGGSTTYTTEVEDWRKSYPALLEKFLREEGYSHVTVVNAGAGNWSSWESLVNFEFRVLDLDPDMIIVYHAVNDIHPRLVWPPEAYRGDNSGYRAAPSRTYHVPRVWEHSNIVRVLMIRFGMIRSHSDLERSLDVHASTYFGEIFRRQKSLRIYPQGIFKVVDAERMLEANPPVYFRRNLENLLSIAKSRGVKSVLATFAYSHRFPNEPRVSSQEYVTALDEANAMIREIATRLGVHLFDFSKVFPDDPALYHDGRHVNEEGAALKAELFGRFLLQESLIPAWAGHDRGSQDPRSGDGKPTR